MSVAYPKQFAEDLDFPCFEGQYPLIYLIASTPRCGSHFLGHCLLGAGHFGAPFEYFNNGNMAQWAKRFGTHSSEETFAHIVRRRTSPSGWFGFKAHWDQYTEENRQIIQKAGGVKKVIFIYRRDLLSQAISFSIARQTGVWIEGAKKKKDAKYSYNEIVGLASRIRKQNYLWISYLNKANVAVKKVSFEEVVKNDNCIDKVFEFIDPTYERRGQIISLNEQKSELKGQWRSEMLENMRDCDEWMLLDQGKELEEAICDMGC